MNTLDEAKKRIDQDVKQNRVILFMKGNRLMPQCGFSAQVVHILDVQGTEYETRNVLEDPELREAIKEYSDWPTLPQLYVDGEFIGGCDIVTQLYESGELTDILGAK